MRRLFLYVAAHIVLRFILFTCTDFSLLTDLVFLFLLPPITPSNLSYSHIQSQKESTYMAKVKRRQRQEVYPPTASSTVVNEQVVIMERSSSRSRSRSHNPQSCTLIVSNNNDNDNDNSITTTPSSPLPLLFTQCTKPTKATNSKNDFPMITAMTTKLFLVLLLSCSSMSYTLSTATTAASPFATTTTSTTTTSASSKSPLFKSFNNNLQNNNSKQRYRPSRRQQQTKLHISNPDYNEYRQGANYPLCLLRRSNLYQFSNNSNHHHNHYNNALLNRIISGRKSIQQRWGRNHTKRRAATFLGIPRKIQHDGERRRGSFYYRNIDDDEYLEYSTSLTSASASSSSSVLSTMTSPTASSTAASCGSATTATTAASFIPSSKRSSSTRRRGTFSSSYSLSNEFAENHDFDFDDLEFHLHSNNNQNKGRKRNQKKKSKIDFTGNDDDDCKELFYLSLRSSYTSVSSSPPPPSSAAIPMPSSKSNSNLLNVSRGGSQSDNKSKTSIEEKVNDSRQMKRLEQRINERIYNSRPVPPLTSTILGSLRQLNKNNQGIKRKRPIDVNDATTIDATTDSSSNYDTSKNNVRNNNNIRPLCNSDISSSRKGKKQRKVNQMPKLQILRYSQHQHQHHDVDGIHNSNDNDDQRANDSSEILSSKSVFGSVNTKNKILPLAKNSSKSNSNKNNIINTKTKYRHHKLLTKEEQTQAKIQWAEKYTSLHTLRQTFGRNRNKFWGDFDSKTTRRLYHTLLPRALLGLYDIGLWSPKELAPLAFEARLAAKKYARERSVVPSRFIAMVYDGFRMWRDWGTWSVEGMSWEQVWDKYETQILEEMIEDCHYDLNAGSASTPSSSAIDVENVDDDIDECCIIDLNEQSVQEEITAQICLRILERSCATNGMIDKLFLEGKNENALKRDADLDAMRRGKGGRISKFKRNRRKRLRRKNAERDLTRIRNRLERDMQELLQIKPSTSKK